MRGLGLAFCVFTSLTAAVSVGCSESPEFGFQTQWLNPSRALDTDRVKQIYIFENDEERFAASWTVDNLLLEDDMDGDGRIEKSFPLTEFNVPVRFTLEGRGESGQPVVLGRTRELTLSEGERRIVALTMYNLDAANLMPNQELPLMLATTTTLLDGRVLIAGGFDKINGGTCPASAPMGSRCYEMTASENTYIFEPTSGQFLQESPLLEARGGHTATRLDSGRVVIAGGAERALLIVTPTESASSTEGLAFEFMPLGSANALTAHSSIEVFDPKLDLQVDDAERDGDPMAGGFVDGRNSGDTAAVMSFQRFMHAAVHLGGERVFLVGGYSGDGGTQSFEVYDDLRPGGAGSASFGALQRPRRMPGAVLAENSVWIVGGLEATAKADLAEIWTLDESQTEIATSRSGFAGTADNILAKLSLMRPSLVTVRDGSNVGILVIGSVGPRCIRDEDMNSVPVFDPTEKRCGSSLDLQTINAKTGSVVEYKDKILGVSFGSVIQFDDMSIASVGGIHDSESESQVSLYKPEFVANNALGDQDSVLVNPRGSLFGAAAALPGKSLLVVGGIDFQTSEPELLPTPIVHQRTRN